jgi:ABC-type dipeptide/oligopeptide/nickel transport system permease subunit
MRRLIGEELRAGLSPGAREALAAAYVAQGKPVPDWWLLFPAGLVVSFLAFAFFLVGRGMDEVINPRLRARR